MPCDDCRTALEQKEREVEALKAAHEIERQAHALTWRAHDGWKTRAEEAERKLVDKKDGDAVANHLLKAAAERLKAAESENESLKARLAEALNSYARVRAKLDEVQPLWQAAEAALKSSEAAWRDRVEELKARLRDAEASVKLGEAVVERVERKAEQMEECLRAVKFEDENAENLTSYTRDLVIAALSSSAPEPAGDTKAFWKRKAAAMEAELRKMVLVTATFVHKVAVHDARISAEKALAALGSQAATEERK